MTPRIRDRVLMAAGVPGVIALFLPIGENITVIPIEHYWEQLRDGIAWPPIGLDWMAALPVAVLLLQARKLASNRAVAMLAILSLIVLTALLQLAGVAFALRILTEIKWSMPRGWLEHGPEALYVVAPMLILSAGNVWLLFRNWRRGESATSITEEFMMGTYIVAHSFWLPGLLAEPVLAPKLMLWTCLAYAVTIVLRLRNSPPQR